MHIDYTVLVTPFTERHYIKSFEKKYKKAWKETWYGLRLEFSSFDTHRRDSATEKITEKENIAIYKTKFRVAGTKQSRSGSGNRCILAVHSDTVEVRVLLVYNKTDLTGSGNETAQWKKIIKDNYQEYTDLL